MKIFERYLFYLLLFSIPIQTRIILWQQNWYFSEWQAASLYVTDILLAILLFFWLFSLFSKKYQVVSSRYSGNLKSLILNTKYFLLKPGFYLAIFVVVSALSIRNFLAFYNFFKLLEFVVFYFYLKNYAVKNFGFINSLWAIIAGGLFQAIVAIIQFFKQSSLGLRLLGESILGPDLTGIASFYNSVGEKVIRAYGTMPHPNILAAYLFLSIFALYFLIIYSKNQNKEYRYYDIIIYHNIIMYGVYGMLLFALFTTFARVAVFLLVMNIVLRLLLIIFKYREEFWNKKLVHILITSVLVLVAFVSLFWPDVTSRAKLSVDEEAVQLRIFYAKESLESKINWLGVGSGNFVNWLMIKEPHLPRNLYQPVHNIYLLIYSENGLLGVTAFILFLIFLIKDFIIRTHLQKLYHYSFLLIALSLLFMGLFDHFPWTLQQGRFVLWLSLALLTINPKSDIL